MNLLQHKVWSYWSVRYTFLAFFLLAGLLLYAHPAQRGFPQSESIREKMLRAHGGGKQISRVNSLEYSVLETKYGSAPPASSRINYYIDLKARQITATSSKEGSTIVKTVNDTGSWQEIDGIRTPLPEEEQQQLERIYFLNLLVLLQNSNLKFEFIHGCQYKGNTANVVLVSNPMNASQQVTLFVSDQTGKVLASTWHEGDQENTMLQYTDLLEYQSIGNGLIYPLEYQVHTNGEVSIEGRMVNIKVKSK
jgi:hypothetical protein